MSKQPEVENEMAYTRWDDSCQKHGPIEVENTGGIRVENQRQCRRARGHEGDHASGYGLHFRQWATSYPDWTAVPNLN